MTAGYKSSASQPGQSPAGFVLEDSLMVFSCITVESSIALRDPWQGKLFFTDYAARIVICLPCYVTASGEM